MTSNVFLQSPRKSKREKEEIIIPLEDLSPIAHPLAQRKLAKKLHKTIKKGLLFVQPQLEFLSSQKCILQLPKLDMSNVGLKKLSKASGKENQGTVS